MVNTAGPATIIGLMNSARGAPLIEAVSTVPKIGVGVGVGVGVGDGDGVGVGVGVTEGVGVGTGVGVGMGVAVGVGAGGNMPATMTPRPPDVPGLSCVKFLIVKNTPSFT
jgi:hypothetical protein